MKKEFFYNQKRLVDWLDDHREIFGLEQKSIQPYVSLWLNDGPSLPSGAKHVLDSVETMALLNPWLLCEPPTEIDDLRPREWWHETLELDFPLKTWEAAGPKRPLNDERRAQVVEKLEAYRKRLRAVCTRQTWDAELLTGFEMEERPNYWGYAQIAPNAWALLPYPHEACTEFVTARKSLQEIVVTMPADKAIAVAARACALNKVEMTLPDIRACELTYEVEITDRDRAWAEAWYKSVIGSMPNVPGPFLGDRFRNVLEHWSEATDHNQMPPKKRRLKYREEHDYIWDGRIYRAGDREVTAVEHDGQWREPTADEMLQIKEGVFWQVDVETKEGLWPIWRDNQLRTGPLGRETREMAEGEEELLLARFDKHWEEYVRPGVQARLAARQAHIDKKRLEREAAAAESEREKRQRELFPSHRSEKDRRIIVDLVNRIRGSRD